MGEIDRYVEASAFYRLSVRRFYESMSVGWRWRGSAYYARKHGAKYTAYEARLAKRYNTISDYLGLDFANCVIHARIALDRAVALARYFLPRSNHPSFTSFSDHKKFFERQRSWHPEFEDYAEHFRTRTDWFDELKDIRDTVLVHQGPKHWKMFGYPWPAKDLHLTIWLPLDEAKPLRRGRGKTFSIREKASHIEAFLDWFAERGTRALAVTAMSRGATS